MTRNILDGSSVMFRTIERQVRRSASTPGLRAEFRQHDFEQLKGFCRLIYFISIVIWVAFDLVVSFIGDQGFTWRSLPFIAALAIMTVILRFVRKVNHFNLLNLLFVTVVAVGLRLVIEGIPEWLQPYWMVLWASSILYTTSLLPLRCGWFLAGVGVSWAVLNPYVEPGYGLDDLGGAMIFTYSAAVTGLTLLGYLRLRQAKFQNFCMSRLLLDQAYVDVLTEIPNRRSFMAKAEQHLRRNDEGQVQYLAMVDIDNFKQVNDRFGHDSGDVVLKRIAATIKASVAEFEYARLGGEEFVIYLWGLGLEAAQERMGRLCREVRESGGEHPVTVSIGLTRVGAGISIGQALGQADEALYSAKRSGKDRYVMWS